jgi:hypothetical protein
MWKDVERCGKINTDYYGVERDNERGQKTRE